MLMLSPACWTGVIVGGGVTGCAMLYNLAKQGVKCVLFEKVSRKLLGKNWMHRKLNGQMRSSSA